MSRREYMKQLETLLSDIPLNERKEALQFYEDYFEDAGAENEKSAMDALGSPEKVAQSIRSELHQDTKEHPGFYDTQEEQKSEHVKRSGRSTGEIVLWIIICILALPVAVPLVGGVLAALFSLFVGLVAVLAAFLIAGAAVLVVGLALGAVAVIKMFTVPVAAIYLLGGGMICAGLGILIMIPFIWLLYKLVPVIFHGLVNLCKRPFQKKGKGETDL